MSTALVNPNNQNQQWLAPIPEELRGQLAAQIQNHPDLRRAIAFVTPELLEGCQTAEEALEVLKELATAINVDEQANYIPAIYTIDHKNQRFVDDAGDAIKGPFRAVVLYFQPTRGFFIEGRKLPLCSAIGTHLKGKAAPDAAEAWAAYKLYNPQLPITWSGQERDCSTCPFNEFGSDPKTGAGKACKEKYRLFLALVDGDGNLTGEGVMMNVPTTSMKNWDGYISRLRRHKDGGKLQPLTSFQIVTEFDLEKATGQGQDYAKVLPKVFRLLNGQEFKMVYEIRRQIVQVAETLGVEVGETYDQQSEPGADGPPPEYADAMPQDGDDF